MAHRVARRSPTRRTSPHRRRRPVGEPAPLPRDLRGTGTLWILTLFLLGAIYFWGKYGGPTAGQFQRWLDRSITSAVPDLSSGGLSTARRFFEGNVGLWLLIAIRWGTAVALIMWKRWRHLAVFVGSVALVTVIVRWFPTAGIVTTGIAKHPAYAAASLAVTVMGLVYGLVPGGKPRRRALGIGVAACIALAAFSILTRAYTPSEIGIGFIIGFSIPFLGFRVFAPEAVFPVTYRQGRAAHLDIGGGRGAAIDIALREQLGLDVAHIEPFGLSGSGGSTPLKIELADGRRLFGKLYTQSHLRADRWYRLGRTVMYGALEDERSFNSVR